MKWIPNGGVPVLKDDRDRTILRFTVGTTTLDKRLERERVVRVLEVERPLDGDGWVVAVETTGRDRTLLRIPEEWIAEGPRVGRPVTDEERMALGGWAKR